MLGYREERNPIVQSTDEDKLLKFLRIFKLESLRSCSGLLMAACLLQSGLSYAACETIPLRPFPASTSTAPPYGLTEYGAGKHAVYNYTIYYTPNSSNPGAMLSSPFTKSYGDSYQGVAGTNIAFFQNEQSGIYALASLFDASANMTVNQALSAYFPLIGPHPFNSFSSASETPSAFTNTVYGFTCINLNSTIASLSNDQFNNLMLGIMGAVGYVYLNPNPNLGPTGPDSSGVSDPSHYVPILELYSDPNGGGH
jgi:hypothetical protein